MQRSLWIASSLGLAMITASISPALSGPTHHGRSFQAPALAPIGVGQRHGLKTTAVPGVPDKRLATGFVRPVQGHAHGKHLRKDVLRDRALFALGAYPYLDYAPQNAPLPAPQPAFFAPDDGVFLQAPPPVFQEAPRPYAPPSFTIIGKAPRKNMGGSVQLVRGGTAEASASDPRVIFLNDDGSEPRAARRPVRRK